MIIRRGCARCKLPYPKEMLFPLNIDGGYTEPICGICALTYTNDLNNTNLRSFDAGQAEVLRLEAVEWREQHPDHRPVS